MEDIIKNLLASDNEVIKKATNDLKEAFKSPESIVALCNITVSSKEPQIRQYAAVLLRKRLAKIRFWHELPEEQQNVIKQGMLNSLIVEKEKTVRTSIGQLVGVLIRHESEKTDPWMNEVLKFVFSHCSAADPAESELGSSVFAILTDVAPDQFVPHMETVCEMFTAALISTEANGNMATPVILNIILGMTYLVPFILGHNAAEHTYQKAVPLIIKALEGFTQQPSPDKFIRAFDILEGMADYTPKLLTINIKILLEFCLETSNNANLDSAIRIKTVAYIGWLVRLKKKAIIKQKMIDPIIKSIFDLMAIAPENDDDDEDYFLGDDNSNPMTTATQTMDLLALNVPPEKLIPTLLALVEPALQSNDPLPRRAAYLSMAVIAEGCAEAICNKYLETMLCIVKVGITDSIPLVRNAAFFALGQFSEHLQPDISKYAPQIMPIMFEFLHALCLELKNGGTEPKHIERMFYALETFCENLEEQLIPHLPILMERLFEALNPNNTVQLRELALSVISAAANAAKENMLPYFKDLIDMLQQFLVQTDDENIRTLRPQAIDALASLARTIGKDNFMPLSVDTMTFALNLLEESDDPDLRRALYNLIASLAEVVNEKMVDVFPRILDRMYDSILTSEDMVPKLKDEDSIIVPEIENDENNDREIDIEESDGEDDTDNVGGYSVENAYLDEKEEAILALKVFALHTGSAFLPFLEKSYQNVYKVIDHQQDDIRKVSIDALTSFIIALHKQNAFVGLKNAVNIFIPKLGNIVHDDEEITVVLSALENLSDILKEVGSEALQSEDLIESVYNCITDILQNKAACQFDETADNGDEDTEESELDEAIVEGACNLLPSLGNALNPEIFSQYFGRIYIHLLQKLEKGKKSGEHESQRAFIYGVIAESFAPLQKYSAMYFDALCSVLIEGLNDEYGQARQNAVFGLGELVFYSGEKSFVSFNHILSALSSAVANETKDGALDNICGAIARLILTNWTLVPLAQVMPVFIQKLPLREDFDENTTIMRCFKSLFIQNRDGIVPFVGPIVAIAIHVLYNNQYVDKETYNNTLDLIREIRTNFEHQFNAVANSNPDIKAFVQTI